MTAALHPAEPLIATERARRGGRAGKRAGGSAAFEQPPFRQLKIPLTPTKLISDDELETIHLASLRVLKEIGVDVLHDGARKIMKEHGADVREGSERVRFDRDMILELIAHCAAGIHASMPAIRRTTSASAATTSSSRRWPRRRTAPTSTAAGAPATRRTTAISCGWRRCTTSCNTTGGYPVEPVDIHASVRHLECIRDLAMLTDKAFHVYSLGKERNVDGIEIARIARGISHEQLLRRAVGLHHHQHQLAAEARHADDGGHHPDVVARPGGDRDAVHAVGRHGAGDDRRRAGAAERRGAGRHRLHADGAGRARRSAMAASPPTST